MFEASTMNIEGKGGKRRGNCSDHSCLPPATFVSIFLAEATDGALVQVRSRLSILCLVAGGLLLACDVPERVPGFYEWLVSQPL